MLAASWAEHLLPTHILDVLHPQTPGKGIELLDSVENPTGKKARALHVYDMHALYSCKCVVLLQTHFAGRRRTLGVQQCVWMVSFSDAITALCSPFCDDSTNNLTTEIVSFIFIISGTLNVHCHCFEYLLTTQGSSL